MTDTAVVLLSGGMDSCVTLFWAKQTFSIVHAITFDYKQKNQPEETAAAVSIWGAADCTGKHNLQYLPVFDYNKTSSLLWNDVDVLTYNNAQEATEKTSSDPALLHLRNAIFISVAASFLLSESENGGVILLGTRDREGGYPDCSTSFMYHMQTALHAGSHKAIKVYAPLADRANSREKTIRLAQTLPGCMEALKYSMSCFSGTQCGKCLPCLRRAQAFACVGIDDPALS